VTAVWSIGRLQPVQNGLYATIARTDMQLNIGSGLHREPPCQWAQAFFLLYFLSPTDHCRPGRIKDQVAACLLNSYSVFRRCQHRPWLSTRDATHREKPERMGIRTHLSRVEWLLVVLELKNQQHFSRNVKPGIRTRFEGSPALAVRPR